MAAMSLSPSVAAGLVPGPGGDQHPHPPTATPSHPPTATPGQKLTFGSSAGGDGARTGQWDIPHVATVDQRDLGKQGRKIMVFANHFAVSSFIAKK
jgi:hypothetical protein